MASQSSSQVSVRNQTGARTLQVVWLPISPAPPPSPYTHSGWFPVAVWVSCANTLYTDCDMGWTVFWLCDGEYGFKTKPMWWCALHGQGTLSVTVVVVLVVWPAIFSAVLSSKVTNTWIYCHHKLRTGRGLVRFFALQFCWGAVIFRDAFQINCLGI